MPQFLPNPPAPLPVSCSAAPSARRFTAPAPLRLWHLASLDAPTVAVAWTLAFAAAFGIRLPVSIPVFLGLAAWAVYIGDRLLDGWSAARTGELHRLAERHRFHLLHQKPLLAAGMGAAVGAVGIGLALMPVAALARTSALSLAALAYLARVHVAPGRFWTSRPRNGQTRAENSFKAKELVVALIFTVACVLPTASRLAGESNRTKIVAAALFLAFALLAWLNCRAIDRWESGAGPRGFGVRAAGLLLGISLPIAAAVLAPLNPRPAALAVAGAVSALLLALLDVMRPRLTHLALRVYADLVLLTPLVLLAR